MQPIFNQAQQDELLKYDIQLMLDNFSLAALLADFLIKYQTAKLPPPSATVFLRGNGPPANIPGENCGFFITPVMHMAILDCRRSLEFFGLTYNDKTSKLKQITSRRTDDLGMESFGLSQVTPENFLRITAPTITGQVEPMLAEVHKFTNKQLAHFTVVQNQVMLPSIRNIYPVMTEAFNHFLFDALGRQRPNIQPSDN
jgi:hypothetical protein